MSLTLYELTLQLLDILKPCPFCGSNNVVIVGDIQKFITCVKCGACSDSSVSDKEAKDKWNRRNNL